MPLATIEAASRNPKRHDREGIRASIGRFGVAELPLVDERTGRLVAGHGRVDQLVAMRDEGQVPPDGVQLGDDGGWQLPVVRGWASRSDAEADAYLVASNKLTSNGGWDDEQLGELLSELDDDLLGLTGFGTDELTALLAAGVGGSGDGGADLDDAPEPPVTPVSVLGDLWLLGRHRVLCGDAADVLAHDRLLDGQRPTVIFTDPPYGVNLQTDYTKVGHGGGKAYTPIVGDDRPHSASGIIAMYEDAREQFWWGADHYRGTIPDGGSWTVWDKRYNDEGMDLDKLFGSVFELCWSRQVHKREIARVLWAMTHGAQRQGEDARRGLHPTQKPVDLVRWFFDRWGKPGDLVADFYGGSGTTLIACERANYYARLIEISPAYVDVICRRYQDLTNDKPLRVLADGGTEPHDFRSN